MLFAILEIFLLCLLCLQSDGAGIGDNCTVNGNCTNGTCVDSICDCVATHYIQVNESIDNKVCQLKINVDESCNNTGPLDQCKDPKSTCSGGSGTYKCTCNTGYDNNGGTCTNQINVDESCHNTGPSDQCKDPKSTCSGGYGTYKCTCNTGYYNNGGTCTIQINVDESCNNTGPSDQCKDPKSTCNDGSGTYKCTCNTGYYSYGGTCTIHNPPIGIIVGAVTTVVVVIGIFAVFVKRRRNRKKPKEKERDDPIGLETIKINRPIVMNDFDKTVEDFHKDDNLKFTNEYEELKNLTDPQKLHGVTTNLAEREENKLKNKYINILPYDKTIVTLLPLADDDENATTYINANYIPGYHSQSEYIASQCPIPSTTDDFWRMIWEQNVAIVVMLTLCKEQGRDMYECYRSTKQDRDIVVELTSRFILNTYEIREFQLKMGDTTRYVKHFLFLNWTDLSGNVQNDEIIDFINIVRDDVSTQDSKVPMIVHCSSGVGQTGTYIALDHLMAFIRDNDFSKSIDIFNIVVEMRKCRMYMVKTEQQYILIYDCIRDILKKKRIREQEINKDSHYDNRSFNVNDEDLCDNTDL